MRIPNDRTKFSAQFHYIEAAYYTPEGKFVREKNPDGTPRLLDVDELWDFAAKHNFVGIYQSIRQYNSTKWSPETPALAPLYFDLDDKANPDKAWTDVNRLFEYLANFVSTAEIEVHYSGQKGFHLIVEPIALGIAPSEDSYKLNKYIATMLEQELDLTTIDHQVYDARRMWRVANTQHQATGLWKIDVGPYMGGGEMADIIELAKTQQPQKPMKPESEFNYTANRWYREFDYQYQESLLQYRHYTGVDWQNKFLSDGVGYIRHFDDDREMVLDIHNLRKRCPTIVELEEKARTKHHLEHYERLFLCSLLTYTPEAISHLHSILSQCYDYNFEKSNAHIEDWIRRRELGIGGRPFTCRKIQEFGLYCSGCDKLTPKHKLIKIDDNKSIVSEEFSDPSPIRFAYTTKKEEINYGF